jgi:hypothetical protein
VHRDVKPDNILLDRESGRALVTDFGIAHVSDVAPADRLTGEGLVMGTALYMSPEQAAGEPSMGGATCTRSAWSPIRRWPDARRSRRLGPCAPGQAPDAGAAPASSAVPARLARPCGSAWASARTSARPRARRWPSCSRRRCRPSARSPAPCGSGSRRATRSSASTRSGRRGGAAGAVSLVRISPGAERDPTFRAGVPARHAGAAIPLGIRLVTRTVGIVHDGYGHRRAAHRGAQREERARADRAQERSPVPVWLARLLRLLAYGSAIGTCHAAPASSRRRCAPTGQGADPARAAPGDPAGAPLAAGVALRRRPNLLGNALGVTWPTHSGRGRSTGCTAALWESRSPAGWCHAWPGGAPRRPPSSTAPRSTPSALPPTTAGGPPRPGRRQLGDVPGSSRLEREARRCAGAPTRSAAGRARWTRWALQGPPIGGRRPRRSCSAARDQALGRRDAAVTALEAVRLDLLRAARGRRPSALTDLSRAGRSMGGLVDAGTRDGTATHRRAVGRIRQCVARTADGDRGGDRLTGIPSSGWLLARSSSGSDAALGGPSSHPRPRWRTRIWYRTAGDHCSAGLGWSRRTRWATETSVAASLAERATSAGGTSHRETLAPPCHCRPAMATR